MGDLLIRPRPDSARRLANAILACGILASLGLFALTLRARASLPQGVVGLLLAALPLAMALGLGLCFRLGREARISLALSLAALASSLWGAELFLTLNPGREASIDLPPGGDTRSKVEVISQLRSQGKEAMPALFPAYMLAPRADGGLESPLQVAGRPMLPLGGAARVETVVCNESGRWLVYSADEMGFPNPPGLWERERLDVAMVGDSFGQGYCVAPDDSFAGLIRARHPASLNLSMSGNGPLIELAALVEFLPRRRPAEVLWFFFEGNDIPGNLAVEKRSAVLMGALEGHTQGLEEHKGAVDQAVRGWLEDRLGAGRAEVDAGLAQRVIGVATLSRLRQLFKLPTASDQADWPLFARIMAEAQRRTDEWGGRLTLVYLPGWTTAMGKGADMAAMAAIHDGVAQVAHRYGITMLDMTPAFANHPDRTALFALGRPNHYSEAGHALVADSVLAHLEKRK